MSPRAVKNEGGGDEPATPTLVLSGRRLFFARRAWIVLAVLAVGLFVASVPFAYARFSTPCEGAGCAFEQLSPEAAEALEGSGLSTGFYGAYAVALAVVFALGYWAIGTVLFWKGSEDRLVLYASAALMAFGATQPDTLRWLTASHPGLDLPIALVGLVGDVSFFVLFCVFPDGRFVPRWTRWAAAAWAVWVLPHTFLPELPRGQGPLATLIEVALAMIGIGLVGSLVVAQVYRYRNASTQAQRQQTKWVVFGFATSIGAFVGVLLMVWVFGLTPFGIPQVLYDLVTDCVITLVALLVPLSIAIAIRNHRLWDIDLIINRAIVYGMLSAVLATVFAVTDALLLPYLVNLIVGEANNSLNVGISAVIIAVLFEPLRRRIQKVVDKLSDRLAGGNGMSEAPG